LTTVYTVTVAAPDFSGVERIQILSSNPIADETATVLAQTPAAGGTSVTLTFSAPTALTQFYAALVSTSGAYTVKGFSAGVNRVDFSSGVTGPAVPSRAPTPQVYTFCFEDEQPEVGDYDYNDLVLRISQQRLSATKLQLDITLAAVGSNKQLSAMLRLAGFSYDDIDSVYTEGTVKGETFDDGYELAGLTDAVKNRNLLQKSLKDEALMLLFLDAHWATGDIGLMQQNMSLMRLKYNVSRTTDTEYELIPPRTITYTVVFKSAAALDRFTLDSLDPFLVMQTNSGFLETHQRKYEGDGVLYNYNMVTLVKLLPWAIVIPTGTFRYPLQGYNMGYRKNGYLFGTYMTEGHSFGEWVEDHTKATDWYSYPTLNMAF
jgi:LruC domain-containing protein